MKVFVYEFVTGGGMIGQDLPPSLAREAGMIVHTLLVELAGLPGVQVLTSRDPRLPCPPETEVIVPVPGEEPLAHFARGLAAADAAWPTAPETGGTLERLARDTLDSGRILLGSSPKVIHVTASKFATFKLLSTKGIPVVPTFRTPESVPALAGPWVIKPDDGAGCDQVRRVPDWLAAQAHLQARPGRLVAQPWVEGEVRSLSLLCAEGQAMLLSVNSQRMRCTDGRLSLAGIAVNDLTDRSGELAELAESVAAALPELWGYVGVDFIQTRGGPILLEINPRLTTSYCGLGAALGINVAGMVLQLGQSGVQRRHAIHGYGTPVEIVMEPAR